MKITLQPDKQLTIHSMYEIPLETLVSNQALSGGNLMWIGDVLISFAGFSSTDKMIHDQVDGIYHWVLLEYTYELKEYCHTIKSSKLNSEVPIFDMSHHPFYLSVARFIKSKADK